MTEIKAKTDHKSRFPFGIVSAWGLVLVAAGLSWYFYPQLPERVASHWGPTGQPDGWMSRDIFIWICPAVMAGINLLLFAVFLIDPLRRNLAKFRTYYVGFIVVMNLFYLGIHLWSLLWNVGHQMSMFTVFGFALGGLFFYIGVALDKCPRNWFFGIRTPWTLSNDIVWSKTHRLAGVLFRIHGIFILFGVVGPGLFLWLILVPVAINCVVLLIYSFVLFRHVQKAKGDQPSFPAAKQPEAKQDRVFTTSWDRSMWMMNLVILALILAVSAVLFVSALFIHKNNALIGKIMFAVAFTPVLILLAGFAFAPKSYALDEETLRIRRFFTGDILLKRDDILSIEPGDYKKVFSGASRVCGSGGGFGIYGLFIDGDRNYFMAYMTRKDKLVRIWTKGKPFILTPDDPQGFIHAVQSLIG